MQKEIQDHSYCLDESIGYLLLGSYDRIFSNSTQRNAAEVLRY